MSELPVFREKGRVGGSDVDEAERRESIECCPGCDVVASVQCGSEDKYNIHIYSH